jgi:small subunit ribosomal protein S25e
MVLKRGLQPLTLSLLFL